MDSALVGYKEQQTTKTLKTGTNLRNILVNERSRTHTENSLNNSICRTFWKMQANVVTESKSVVALGKGESERGGEGEEGLGYRSAQENFW